MPTFRTDSREHHVRGTLCRLTSEDVTIEVIVTTHARERLHRWQLTEDQVFETLLSPNEVLTGHGGRYIAHRLYEEHVLRVVYEYFGSTPLIVTMYFPYASRYYQGGGSYADQILS